MTVYIDGDYKCHGESSAGRTEITTDFFDDKCAAFIEGYRFVPEGQTWTRADGVVFTGEMIAPFMNFARLDAAQREYERQELVDMKAALAELGVE